MGPPTWASAEVGRGGGGIQSFPTWISENENILSIKRLKNLPNLFLRYKKINSLLM
jgi:hypothetical protein